MLWKDYKCEDCGETQKNVNSKIEDTERECPSCGGKAKIILYPKFTKFKGAGWTTPRHVETFPDEPEDPSKWGEETHGVEGSLGRDIDPDWGS
jgi:putative FmdB family regulatory protein